MAVLRLAAYHWLVELGPEQCALLADNQAGEVHVVLEDGDWTVYVCVRPQPARDRQATIAWVERALERFATGSDPEEDGWCASEILPGSWFMALACHELDPWLADFA